MIKKIKKLQKSDDKTKTKWLWGLTIFSGAIVIFIWSFYINFTIQKITRAESQKANSHAFTEIFYRGISQIKRDSLATLNIIFKERTIDLKKNNEISFVYSDLEEMPMIKLP